MRTAQSLSLASGLLLSLTAGCTRLEWIDEDLGACGACVKTMCPSQSDLAQPPDLAPSKCAAAQGLPGDNLLCVDFNKVANLGELTGWDFNKYDKDCWEIAAGKLQVKSFGSAPTTCGFILPSRAQAEFEKYGRFTLSVIQKIEIDDGRPQKALVMFGFDDDRRLVFDWMTGKQPRKQWIQTIAKTDIPSGSVGLFQPLFKLSAPGTVTGFAGWQIESIAVQGLPPL